MIKVKALRAFPFATDGVKVVPVEKDAEFEVEDRLVQGLVDAGYVEASDGSVTKTDPAELAARQPSLAVTEAATMEEARAKGASEAETALLAQRQREALDAAARSRTGALVEQPAVDEAELAQRMRDNASSDPARDRVTPPLTAEEEAARVAAEEKAEAERASVEENAGAGSGKRHPRR